jgi:hypothetical protein
MGMGFPAHAHFGDLMRKLQNPYSAHSDTMKYESRKGAVSWFVFFAPKKVFL